MIVLRKNTLSQFDISKKKLFVDFDGVEKNGSDVPTKIKCLFSASDSIKKINITVFLHYFEIFLLFY